MTSPGLSAACSRWHTADRSRGRAGWHRTATNHDQRTMTDADQQSRSRDELDIPSEVPIIVVDDDQLAAIESFFDEYAEEYPSLGKTTAKAVIQGPAPAPNQVKHGDAAASGRDQVDEIELNGETIPFTGAYRTRKKHEYYSGIHVAGYRLTVSYHSASGGSYYQLRVTPEEDL